MDFILSAEGFRRYLASPRIAAAISTSLDRELAEGETNAYDTHPPLRARLAALEPQSDCETPSLILRHFLVGEMRLETRLIKRCRRTSAQASQLVAWDDVDEDLANLGGLCWSSESSFWNTLAPSLNLLRNLDPFQNAFGSPTGQIGTGERREQAAATLGVALAVALSRNGWELRPPGEDVVCERDGTLIKPFDIIPKLASGELTAEAWQEFSNGAGIADLDLGGETIIPQEASSEQRAP
jgi:hypothetical protein